MPICVTLMGGRWWSGGVGLGVRNYASVFSGILIFLCMPLSGNLPVLVKVAWVGHFGK